LSSQTTSYLGNPIRIKLDKNNVVCAQMPWSTRYANKCSYIWNEIPCPSWTSG
jgi:hypothetical protein